MVLRSVGAGVCVCEWCVRVRVVCVVCVVCVVSVVGASTGPAEPLLGQTTHATQPEALLDPRSLYSINPLPSDVPATQVLRLSHSSCGRLHFFHAMHVKPR